jgi:hypothetical protein
MTNEMLVRDEISNNDVSTTTTTTSTTTIDGTIATTTNVEALKIALKWQQQQQTTNASITGQAIIQDRFSTRGT